MHPGDFLPVSILNLPLALADGNHTCLADHLQQNHWLVVYFYPKNHTPGCTTEGLEFNALLPEFERLNARVLGVSRDSVRSHANFCGKYGFDFPLISDANEALCTAFDVIKPKNIYGKLVRGIERSTFLISPRNQLMWEWRKVRAAGHAKAVFSQFVVVRAYCLSQSSAG